LNRLGLLRGTPPGQAYLGLGSNLGNREGFLQEAILELGDRGAQPLLASSLYDTDPVGIAGQGNFLNLVLEVAWMGSKRELLDECHAVENLLGRARTIPGGPRTLDIDILLCDDRVFRTPDLQIPHPRLHLRRFVLVPLAEIAPGMVHPVLQVTIAELLSRCEDDSGVRMLPDRLSLERVMPTGYNPAASRGKG